MGAARLSSVVAFAVAGGVTFLAVERWNREPEGCRLPVTESNAPLGPPTADDSEARSALIEAKNLVREGRWHEAHDRFEAIKATWPRYADGMLEQYLERCNEELLANDHAGRARQLLDEGRFEDAKYQIALIGSETEAGERLELEARLQAEVARLMKEARELRAHPKDAEKMARLRGVAEQIVRLDPELQAAQDLADEAKDALEEIETPWVSARRAFDEGDAALALGKARACAKEFDACQVMVKPLAKLAPNMGRLNKLGTPVLLELLETAHQLADESSVGDSIADVIVARYQATAKRCRARSDWACVDQQLALAAELDLDFDDESYLTQLNAHASEEVMRAYELIASDPKKARPMLQHVLALKQVDERWRDLAQRLDGQLAAP